GLALGNGGAAERDLPDCGLDAVESHADRAWTRSQASCRSIYSAGLQQPGPAAVAVGGTSPFPVRLRSFPERQPGNWNDRAAAGIVAHPYRRNQREDATAYDADGHRQPVVNLGGIAATRTRPNHRQPEHQLRNHSSPRGKERGTGIRGPGIGGLQRNVPEATREVCLERPVAARDLARGLPDFPF